jgi:hypothetical protein
MASAEMTFGGPNPVVLEYVDNDAIAIISFGLRQAFGAAVC